jgi:hypothetical protein
VLGIAALALSDMVFGAVTVFMVVRSMRRVGYRYRFGGEALLRMAVIAMLVAGLGWLVMRGWTGHETALAAVITGFVMLVLYWGLNMVWKPFNEKERELLKKITGRAPMPF